MGSIEGSCLYLITHGGSHVGVTLESTEDLLVTNVFLWESVDIQKFVKIKLLLVFYLKEIEPVIRLKGR
jgi:hypothetical protein